MATLETFSDCTRFFCVDSVLQHWTAVLYCVVSTSFMSKACSRFRFGQIMVCHYACLRRSEIAAFPVSQFSTWHRKHVLQVFKTVFLCLVQFQSANAALWPYSCCFRKFWRKAFDLFEIVNSWYLT